MLLIALYLFIITPCQQTTLNAFSKSYKPRLKNQVLDLTNEIIQLIDWNRYELATNVALCTVLLDVFGKCGDINQVQELFKSRFIQQGTY